MLPFAVLTKLVLAGAVATSVVGSQPAAAFEVVRAADTAESAAPTSSLSITVGVPAPAELSDSLRRLTQYRLQRWTDADGLPQNSLWAMAQTPDGFVWLASEQGLIRYDGRQFNVYNSANTPELRRSHVLALAVGPDGTLWAGTAGGGLVSYVRGEFRAFTSADGLPSDYVQSLAVARDAIWAGTDAGLARIGSDGVRVFGVDSGLRDDDVMTIAVDSAGLVWAGTRDGLAEIRGARLRLYTAVDGLSAPFVRAVAPAAAGGVWVGTDGGGVMRADSTGLRPALPPLAAARVFALHEDSHGDLWVGTSGDGLYRVGAGRSSTDTDLLGSTRATGLLDSIGDAAGAADVVWALLEDQDGSMWVGSNGRGLLQLRESDFVPFGLPEGLSGEIALAVLEGRDGSRWIGTAGDGLNRLLPSGELVRYNAASGLNAGLILSLAELPDGDLLVGSTAGSIHRFDGTAFRPHGARMQLRHSVMAMLPDPDGGVWYATGGGGLHHLRGANHSVFTRADGLAADFVINLHRSSADGALWVGTRQGITRLVDGRIAASAASAAFDNIAVSAFHDAPDGSLLVGTQGSGLARIDAHGVAWLTSADGLCEDFVHAIVADDRGQFWMSSNRGIMRVRRADLDAWFAGRSERVPCTLHDGADGMRSREVNGGFMPAAARLADGHIMFPTMQGVVTFDPARIEPAADLPAVVLDHAVVGEDTLRLVPGEALRLEAQRDVQINFTTPAFVAPERVRFRFRLAGFEDEWRDAIDRRTAYYTNVPPGDYRFEVVATDPDGRARSGVTALAVIVPPRFHETWWFRVLCGLALVVAAILLHRYRIATMQSRAARLSALVDERSRAEERYRDLFEHASDVVFTTDLEGIVQSWNSEAERLTGVTKPEAIGRPIATILPGIGAVANPERRDVVFEARDGRPGLLEINTRAVREQGHAVGYHFIGRDIYEWSRMQQQLQQAQKMEAVGRLAGGIAHDFNNLLTVIRGNVELLEAKDQSEYDEIVAATESASALTQQLLAFSRSQILQTRALDLNRKIRDAHSLLARLIGEDIELIMELHPDLPPVRGDRAQIEQIVMNLIVNARDAMPDGGRIEIGTRPLTVLPSDDIADELEPGDYVEMRIADTGAGMDRVTQTRIFEPFFTTKEAGRGTGLGLATVYGAVKQSGGHIIVRSRPGAGTAFRVLMPVAREEPQDGNLPDEVASSPTPIRRVAEARILLVEDEAAVRTLAGKVLERAGYEVVSAESGAAALERLAERDAVDLLLTDIVMPGMNGRELAQKVLQTHPGTSILYMSGYTEDEVIRRGVLPEGEQFLPKPFTPNELLQAVSTALEGAVSAT